MEKKTWRKVQLATYRFWIEYHQFIEGTTTRRMQKRARHRKTAAGSTRYVVSTHGFVSGLGQVDLAGI